MKKKSGVLLHKEPKNIEITKLVILAILIKIMALFIYFSIF